MHSWVGRGDCEALGWWLRTRHVVKCWGVKINEGGGGERPAETGQSGRQEANQKVARARHAPDIVNDAKSRGIARREMKFRAPPCSENRVINSM